MARQTFEARLARRIRDRKSKHNIEIRECDMIKPSFAGIVPRRTIIKAAAVAGAAQIAAPFVLRGALGETPVKIGFENPLTGVYAANAENEVIGAKFAVEEINAKGGINGRQLELLVEDSANDTGTGVQKARKLIERDEVVFMMGDVNSGISQAVAQVTHEKGILHIVPGGHTDSITGSDCHWNVFRVCNTTRMETNSISDILFTKFGKKWHFITADYAFGHTLQEGFEASIKKLGGTKTGAESTPLGTSDFSAYLIKARAAAPDVLILLLAGDDMVNCLKQVTQFGIDKQIKIAGAQQELEVLEALSPNARIGNWVFEWYWKQPGVPGVDKFNADIRKRTNGKLPTARTWFGYASVHTFGLAANGTKSVDSKKMAKMLEGLELPPEVKLQPNKVYFRKIDHQLMTSAFVGEALAKPASSDPEDLFRVDSVVPGDKTALTEAETGCKPDWPA
jgi:branched-chain amino acid transport system substrate-binding protein